MSNSTADQGEASQLVKIGIPIVLGLHFCVFFVQIPLSLLNIGILCRTSLLHRNLKFILFIQSVLFCTFALTLSIQFLIVAFCGIQRWASFTLLVLIIFFLTTYTIYIGHVLFVERTMATIMANKYESVKNNWFSASWFIIFTVYSFIVAFKQANINSLSTFTIVSGFLSLVISFLEIFTFSMLSKYNANLFNKNLKCSHSNGHNLTERYQLAENIRTGHQLWPTFLLHFFIIGWASIFIIMNKYFLNSIIYVLLVHLHYLFLSFCLLLIEYTLISRHPILRQNAVQILKKIFNKFFMQMPCFNRVNDNAKQPTIGSIDGINLPTNDLMNETDQHFKMLKELW